MEVVRLLLLGLGWSRSHRRSRFLLFQLAQIAVPLFWKSTSGTAREIRCRTGELQWPAVRLSRFHRFKTPVRSRARVKNYVTRSTAQPKRHNPKDGDQIQRQLKNT